MGALILLTLFCSNTYLFLINCTDRRERKPRPPSDPEVSSRSVFVSGLPYSADEESLFNFFSSIGPVVKAKINFHFVDGERTSKGSGLVEFESVSDCKRAISELDGSDFDGRNIRCRQDRVFEDRQSNSNNNTNYSSYGNNNRRNNNNNNRQW